MQVLVHLQHVYKWSIKKSFWFRAVGVILSRQEVQCTILAALNAHLINNQIFPKESLVKI